jgi:hypothetical protein
MNLDHECRVGLALSRRYNNLKNNEDWILIRKLWRIISGDMNPRAAHRNRKLTALRPGFTGDYPYRWSLKLIVLRAVMLTANYR